MSDKYSCDLQKHRTFVNKFLIFPQKTRKVIYTTLLRLPLNHSHFLQLTKPFSLLPQHTGNKQTAFIVNALTKLYPSLGNQWLPGLVYPFVKLFQEDSIVCFQMALTFLLNWYQPIYENYPNPSKKIVDFAKKHLKKLDAKVNTYNYTLSAVLNPMILVCFTDVLNRKDSLQLLDFLVTHPYSPQYFICAAISIIMSVQQSLCKLSTVEEISVLLRKQKKLNIQQVIRNAVELANDNRKQLDMIYNRVIFPLTEQRYPVYEFIKTQCRRSNSAIQKAQYDGMSNLHQKYRELQSLLNNKLKQGLISYPNDINCRYQSLQGQTLQHLNQKKHEHQMKLKALKEIQEQFRIQINSQDQMSKDNDKNSRTIQRRGRLEKEILKMEQQAKKIRQLEQDLVIRMRKVQQIRKNQILQTNTRLKQQQRNQRLYDD